MELNEFVPTCPLPASLPEGRGFREEEEEREKEGGRERDTGKNNVFIHVSIWYCCLGLKLQHAPLTL